MRTLTCFIIVIFISLILCCVESRFARRGGFRSSRYRASSRRIGSWSYWYPSSRRASSLSTNAPRRSYYDSNFYSRRASRVTTIRPDLNERRNFDTRNRMSSRRISSDESTRRSYYPEYNARTSIYPIARKYNNEGRVSSSFYPDKVDHSGTKTAVIAGLGGSALGAYLGYQLSNMQNQHLTGPVGYNPPQYSVVHHYHHGNNPIIKDAKIDDQVVTQCNNVALCTPNSQPLCLTNGTIYCISPMRDVKKCNTTSGEVVSCLITTLTVPCKNGTDSGCNGNNPVKHETVEIPCVTNLFISSNLNTGKLQIHQIVANNLPVGDNTTGTLNEFCVTVIAEPISRAKLS